MINAGQEQGHLNILLELYEKKRSLLEEMLCNTLERCGLDEALQAAEILCLLEKRQCLIDGVDEIDQKIKEFIGDCPPERLAEKVDLLEKKRFLCLKLAEEMWELDRQQQQRLDRQFTAIKNMGEKIRAGRQTIDAYRKRPDQSGSVFIDKKE